MGVSVLATATYWTAIAARSTSYTGWAKKLRVRFEQQTRVVADERSERRSIPREVDVEVSESPVTSPALPDEGGRRGDLSVSRAS